MQKHIIHKQRVVLEMSRQEEAFEFQSKISALFSNGLQAAIENVLDEVSPHNEVIRINKLSIDLGAVNAQNFEAEFKSKFVTALKKAVTAGKAESSANGNVVVTRQSQSNREAVKYFLENGTLPWYSHVKNMQAWEKELLEQWNEDDWRQMQRWLKTQHTSPHVINRLIYQFSNIFLEYMLVQPVLKFSSFQTVDGYKWPALFDDVFVIARYTVPKGDAFTRTRIWQAFAAIAFSENMPDNVAAFFAQFIVSVSPVDVYKNLPSGYQQLLGDIKTEFIKDILVSISQAAEYGLPLSALANWEGAMQTLARLQRGDETALEGMHRNKSNSSTKDEFAANENVTGIKETDGDTVGKQQQNELSSKPQPVAKKIGSGKAEEISYVNNCGIVLLHPFLLSYFTDLGLVQEKQFVDDVAQRRAVLLLYYLTTGETAAAEFNLGLQKILCGLPPEETLESSIELTAKETEESANLLRAVIDYWPPLKNTSIKGFQITFLQRDGKISTTNDGKLLRVEQKAVDVLLGKLPWGFSAIRLPWMQQMLNVEWS